MIVLLLVLAGAPAQPLRVSALHPRVFVRHNQAVVGKGLRVHELRRRAADPAYAAWRDPVAGSSAAANLERAARYLESGHDGVACRARVSACTHVLLRKTRRERFPGGGGNVCRLRLDL